ncbi:MAG: transglycosylase domain-containing protein [Bacteroidia bacterium]|nr:transglycosylase domain-containing protein [Bacteroidia bacterium]
MSITTITRDLKKQESIAAQVIHSPKKPSYKTPRNFFLGMVFLGVIAILGFITYTARDLPPLNEIENPHSNLSTQVIAADGMVLDNFYITENRVNVKLNDVSPYVIDALVATEDARFYEHSGVDYWSIPAIIKRYLTGTTSGGSTITMQLSRNLFNAVSQERTVTRKIKEVIVSAILEKNYTKQEILEGYLNTVNIYGNAYGIEMAAQRLFGKSAQNLLLEEAAVMIGMLKGQGVFDPINNPDTVISRRNVVINQMVRYGFLDGDSINIDSLKQLPIVTAAQGHDHVQGTAPYFRQHVRDFIKEWCKNNPKPDGSFYDPYADGLKVFTTLDSRMQKHAESAVSEHLAKLQQTFDKHLEGHEPYKDDPTILTDLTRQSHRYLKAKKAGKSDAEIDQELAKPVKMRIFSWKGDIDTTMSPLDSIKYYAQFLETGLVSIDPLSGEIKAWVGGIDFEYFKYDHVGQGKRQVGSTFKPFVYAAAIDYGNRTPCDRELNQPVVFENTDGDGTRWIPKNSDGSIGGLMTLRAALATSTNLVTARLIKQITPTVVARYAQRMGIQTPLDPVPSLCLGTTDLSVLELTGAYGTFVNRGRRLDPHFITRIEDNKGNILAEFHPTPVQALSEKSAYMMVELLKGVVDEPGGTASRLRYMYKFRNEIGAKTGTTQNHSDGWFVGITPNLVSGVWVGCADRRVRFRTITMGQGASMALPIWAIYMQKLYEDPEIGLPQDRFPRPGGFDVNFACGDRSANFTRGMPDSGPASSDDLDSFD